MAIDTTIQFNDHNSYKITTPLFCYPFGVDGMSYITHSFQAYSTSSLSSANRAKTKFFDSTGATLSEASHAFAVTTVFGKIEITVAVPATAKQAQLVLLQGGADWWIAEPKSEQGEVATPYNVNYQGQLSYITPNGAYFGMVTTEQIVVSGSILQPDETLDTRLVTINNGVINLSSTLSAKTTKITNDGVYTGEVRADQITSGYISADRIQAKTLTGSKLADGTVQALQIAAGTITATQIASSTITGSKIAAGTITADKIDVTNLSAVRIFQQGSPHITARLGSVPVNFDGSSYTGNGLAVFDSNYSSSTPLISLSSIGAYLSLSNRDKAVLWANEFATVIEGQHASNSLHVSYTGDIYMRHKISGSSNIHAIGVDENGPYYTKNSSKTYF